MKRLTFEETRAALPALDELRPLVQRLLGGSAPDPARTWAGSGTLETALTRLVDPADLLDEVRELADREARYVRSVMELSARAVERLAAADPTGAAEAFLEAAALEEGRQRPLRAEAYADAAVRAVRDEGDPGVRSRALRRRARARRALSRLAEALRDYAEARVIAEALSDMQGAAEAAIGAGNVLEDEARWDEAEQWYERALQTLDAGEAGASPERWQALLNVHIVRRSRGELEESLEPLHAAEGVARDLGDSSAVPFLENAWGQWHMARGEYDQAVSRLRNGLAASESPRARVVIRLNLAEALLGEDRILDAIEEARRVEEEAIHHQLTGSLPEVYRLLGRISALEGNPDAFVLFERALMIIRDHGLPDIERARTLSAYADAEARVGDPDAAADLRAQAEATYRQLGIRRHDEDRPDSLEAGTDRGPDQERPDHE